MSALFHTAVIRYAKPFLNSDYEGKKIAYRLKWLTRHDHFSKTPHFHLIELRNTLIGNDDFEKVEPRLLIMGLHFTEIDATIPLSLIIANKTISRPAGGADVLTIIGHLNATGQIILDRLYGDLAKLREMAIYNPEIAALNTKALDHHLG